MPRIALVTGGTRGIGAEISRALKAAGRTVIASYAGNDAAAQAFNAETGIPVRKFDAGDFAACQTAVESIRAEFGMDVLNPILTAARAAQSKAQTTER